jgi:hypothetical protein
MLASTMVTRQLLANQAAHVEQREDFILLHERGNKEWCERYYQRLIQELPELTVKALADDLQRTTLLVDADAPDLESLVWKYHVGVRKELQRRSDQRLARLASDAQTP